MTSFNFKCSIFNVFGFGGLCVLTLQLFRCPLGELHGEAMDGAVLADDGAGVDGQDVVVGEGGGEDAGGLVVFRRLVVGGEDDASVDDEEVGISGWQAVAIGLVDGIGQGEPVQSVGLAVPISVYLPQ